MSHCKACSFDGNDQAVFKHQKERQHDGICDGKWEQVSRQGGLFYTQDSQFVCWKCGKTCVKVGIPYK